jgi:hypothetical protein
VTQSSPDSATLTVEELATVRSMLKQSGYDDRAPHYECYKDFDCIKFYELCMAQAALEWRKIVPTHDRIEKLEEALQIIAETANYLGNGTGVVGDLEKIARAALAPEQRRG